MYKVLAVLAAFTVIYSAVGGGVERRWISGPIVFTVFGLIIGPLGLGVLSMKTDPEALRNLAELALALILFTDACEAGDYREARRLEARLLFIGLPLTILLGFAAGRLVFGELPLLEIALLATMLAPTDAALGKPVVTNDAVPGPIRQGLTVESGLNDGLCVPILLLFLTLATDAAGDQTPWQIGVGLFLEEVGIGLAAGAVISGAAVWLLGLSRRRGWLSPTWSRITIVAIAFACFATAQAFGGSGFIASFFGGWLFGRLHKHHAELVTAAEGIGDGFAMLTWILFGSAVVGQAVGQFSWLTVLYAVLSLTVIRMVPVFIALSGLGIGTEGKLFLGWFGPRGLASIVFAIIVIGADLPDADRLAMVVACTVILSIVLHGVTANPWARGYGRRAASRERKSRTTSSSVS